MESEQEFVTLSKRWRAAGWGAGTSFPHFDASLHSIGSKGKSQRKGKMTVNALGSFSLSSIAISMNPCLSPVVGQTDEITGLFY